MSLWYCRACTHTYESFSSWPPCFITKYQTLKSSHYHNKPPSISSQVWILVTEKPLGYVFEVKVNCNGKVTTMVLDQI